jgi:1-acyl-sn-glycerol-3-phosphate acyltransferase
MRIFWPWIYICMSFATCLVGPCIAFWMRRAERLKAHRWVRYWCETLFSVSRVEYRVFGAENLPEKQGYILMANHESNYDGPAIIVGLPVPAYFVIKKELSKIPVWGWTARQAGSIIVDRQQSNVARQALSDASVRVMSGSNVIIFPEGTRGDGAEMQPFKRGGFHLALEAQADIVPVYIGGSAKVLPKLHLAPSPGVIEIHFGKPIPTVGKDPEEIVELIDALRSQLNDLRTGNAV